MKEPKEYPLIPNDAFLYRPELSSMLSPSGKLRLIFEGNVQFTPTQAQKLQDFDQYLTNNRIVLDEYWIPGRKLRLLQAHTFNFQQTIVDMKKYLEWIKNDHPLQLTPQIEKLLNQGIIYLSGRDSTYRPIVVFDTKKALEVEISPDEYTQFLSYFFQHIIDNLLIQGQVQNWVVIIDLAGMGIMSSMDLMKKVGYALSARFHNRMGRGYIVNAPTTFSLVWAVAKKFLYEDTVKKISFTSKSVSKQIFQDCNPTQIQKKFGGSQPNIIHYWPNQILSNQFNVTNKPINLITKQKYFQLYLNQTLTGCKINKSIIDKFTYKKTPSQTQVLSPIKALSANRKSQNIQEVTFNRTNLVSPQTSILKIPSITSLPKVKSENKITFSTKLKTQSLQSLTTGISSSKSLISLQGCINPIIHFQLNSNKPRTFKI